MSVQPLDYLPIWAVFVTFVALFALSGEVGYRVGSYQHRRAEAERVPKPSGATGAVLALFAFMLAFTFGLGSTRFVQRRQLVIVEANAIGTAHLRTELIPQPQRQRCKDLLRDYVRIRVELARDLNGERLTEGLRRTREIHKKLWAVAVSLKDGSDYTEAASLFIRSLNELIDLHSQRWGVAVRQRIPMSIWITLYSLGVFSLLLRGYVDGVSGMRRSTIAGLILILAFSSVLLLIIDLDRLKGQYLVGISQEAMVQLLEDMRQP